MQIFKALLVLADERHIAMTHHRAQFVLSHDSSSDTYIFVALAHARRRLVLFEGFRPSAA